MTRLKQAWLALCGKLEPEVREVMGQAHLVPIYVVTRHHGMGGMTFSFYHTCEQAHSEHPGLEVQKREAIKVDGRYFSNSYGLTEWKVEPKPKIAKGKRKQ